jgi:hypothetical protein
MSLETKLILEEMQKQFNEQNQMLDKRFVTSESKWEQRFTDLESRGEDCVAKMEKVTGELQEWRSEIEGKVDENKLEVGKLTKHWERSVRECVMGHPGIITQRGSSIARPPEIQQIGPAGTALIRAIGRMDVGTLPHFIPPVKGA